MFLNWVKRFCDFVQITRNASQSSPNAVSLWFWWFFVVLFGRFVVSWGVCVCFFVWFGFVFFLYFLCCCLFVSHCHRVKRKHPVHAYNICLPAGQDLTEDTWSKNMKAEALNDPEKNEKTMYKSPETYCFTLYHDYGQYIYQNICKCEILG